MVLHVIAHLSESEQGGPAEANVMLDNLTLMFFDTVVAELKRALNLDPRAPFDYFEYEEDGFLNNVRTDEEVQALHESPPETPLHIWLKSSRAQMQEPSTSADLPINSNDFDVINEIASGQFGTVLLARDVRNDRLVAIKTVAADVSMNDVQQEVDVLTLGKDCPQIVQFYGAIYEDYYLKIILEFMDGLSLDRYEPLPLEVHGAVSASIIDALSFLWSKSVIHRDIKPSNFLVNTKGDVKLTDFGVSRYMLVSRVRTVVGTLAYLAPERVRGGAYSVASDVWSLGLSLYEMALGVHSWIPQDDGNSTSDIPQYVINHLPQILNEVAIIDSDLEKLIMGCLRIVENERLAARSLCETSYIKKHTPVNKQLIAEFILMRTAANVDYNF